MGQSNHQLMYAEESAWGTPVTVTESVEIVRETLTGQINYQDSQGISSGRRYGGRGRWETSRTAGGTVSIEVPYVGFEKWYEHLLGAVATTQPDVTNSPTVYLHTFTPGTLTGKSLTLQKGVESNDGTVFAFTYPGSKIAAIGFSIDTDGVLQMPVDYLCRQEVTSTALASASYTAPDVLHYAQGAVLIDDATNGNVISFNFTLANNFPQDRLFKLGNAGLMSEPRNYPRDTLGGTVRIEFEDRDDFYEAFAADTSTDLNFEFTGDLIDNTFSNFLKIDIEDARFEGDTPQVPDTGPIVVDVPFTGWDPSSGEAITITYQNTESTYGA